MESGTLAKSLIVFDEMVASVKTLGFDPLGPTYGSKTFNELQEALVVHRMTAKYEVPNEGLSASRRETSIHKMLDADRSGLIEFDYRRLPCRHRAQFLKAQDWLRVFFKDFRHNYRLRFPTGETVMSSRGKVDLFHKLRNLEQWQISSDCVPYAVEIILRNRALGAVVKTRYREKYGARGIRVLNRVVRSDPKGPNAKTAFRFMLRACCSLNRTARVTTVPKDNNEDRVISCEGLWTMICQLSYSSSLRDHLRKKLGFDLETRQDVHRALIRSGRATIDLSKASDSNYMCVLAQLWPVNQFRNLEKLRTGIFSYSSDGEECFHPLRMLAPMGCGFTFEVMTITLLAHARSYDNGASVFGDDIIISRDAAASFCDYLECMGWKINSKKSFIDGNFRESCGAFCAVREQKFINSYDFRRPSTMPEVYILGGKMFSLLETLPNSKLRSIMVAAYARLLLIVPRDSLVDAEYAILGSKRFMDWALYAPDIVVRNSGERRSSPVVRCLETSWQRTVNVVRRSITTNVTAPLKVVACPTRYACFMRRGAAYAVPIGKTSTSQVPCDVSTGRPIRAELIASVING